MCLLFGAKLGDRHGGPERVSDRRDGPERVSDRRDGLVFVVWCKILENWGTVMAVLSVIWTAMTVPQPGYGYRPFIPETTS